MSTPLKTANDMDAVAADWVVRGQGDDIAEADLIALTQWLDASPEHCEAYERALLAWADVADAAPAETILAQQLSGHLSHIQAERSRRQRQQGQGRRRLWLGGGAMAAAAAGVAMLVVLPQMTPPTVYETVKGERKSVQLADGSTLRLNTDTRISVRLASGSRQLVLDHGEVGLSVVHDARRPLRLTTGDVVLTDLGTQFDVRRSDGNLQVAVTEGSVEMAMAGHNAVAVLKRGDQLVRQDGSARIQVSQVAPDEVFAWTTSHAIYHDVPLAVVVKDLNRYFTIPIRVDERAGELRMTAMLTLDSEASVVRRLQDYLSLRVETTSRAIVLHRGDQPHPGAGKL